MKFLMVDKALGSTSAQTGGFFLNAGSTIVASGLSGAETIGILIHIDGSTYVDAKDESGAAIELDATNNSVTILGTATYAIDAIGTTVADIKVVAYTETQFYP